MKAYKIEARFHLTDALEELIFATQELAELAISRVLEKKYPCPPKFTQRHPMMNLFQRYWDGDISGEERDIQIEQYRHTDTDIARKNLSEYLYRSAVIEAANYWYDKGLFFVVEVEIVSTESEMCALIDRISL